jgi:cytochrome c-type biogenesis protein CcmH/NrfF
MKNGAPLFLMHPARVFYKSRVSDEPPQPNTEVSIERSLKEDLYLVLLSFDPQTQSIFLKAVVNPLTQWIWLGGLFIIFGTILVMWPASTAHVAAGSLAKAASWLLVIGALVALAFPLRSAYAEPLTEEAISKKLVCQCGCGFPDLASCSCGEWAVPAKAEIRARIARGEDEATILKYFIGRHGEKVLTTPLPQGFNRAAWIIPGVAMVLGLGVVGIVLARWKKRSDQAEEPISDLAPQDDKYRKQIDEELYGPSSSSS